ncbi:hypothetical protein M422DRAFT_171420 [Sphaerobolus stellatus SS14]|uniref:FAD/NAD(P)-binding domain-containing protein n=1 Tax=Sphaerobolus stellatus (strain SS14) TaxID=990650 RepID=A0A0C9VU50_SPHS4|nr:hypothetical protein M422DRAFT_171420 [Sphaerobolus stellatus SS14]
MTLITKHDEYQHFPATVRAVVTDEGHLEDSVFIPYDKIFPQGKGRVLKGTVTAIESDGKDKGGRVVLESGDKVAYDALVLSTGNTWAGTISDFPPEKEKNLQFINDSRSKIKTAKTIAIAGGGSVGAELAGEIKEFYPEKHVILVHGPPKLLNDVYPDRFRDNVAHRLKAKNVILILGDYIDNLDDPRARTRKGVSLNADLILTAFGGRANNDWVGQSLGETVLSKTGFVKVKPTLQVQGHNNIFAMGDMIDWAEQKQSFKAKQHASVVATNILPVLEGQVSKKEYKSMGEAMIVTNGTRGGSVYFGFLFGLRLGDFFARLFKSKELIISMTRASLGYTS